MNTLVIIAHPNIKDSIVNKHLLDTLQKNQGLVTIHQLYLEYPDEIIDIQREQDLLLAHQAIVFQFPFYWFSCPPLMKKWMDDVLADGFAYGSGPENRKLKNKAVGFAISTGIEAKEYSRKGRYFYTLEELFAPFYLTWKYVDAHPLSAFTFSGIENGVDSERLELSAADYIKYIKKVASLS